MQGLEAKDYLVKDQENLGWVSVLLKVLSVVHLELFMDKADIVLSLHDFF